MIALSCIVVVCTVYALSLPAQTMTCDKEEHTHTAECYDENNELICEKEEHTHTDDCNKQEEVNEQEEVVKDEPETQNKDEQVSQESEEETTTTTTTETRTQPFDLNVHTENIESVKFVYKKTEIIDGKEKTTEYDVPTDGSILSYDTLDMTYKLFFKGISATTLKECGGIVTYQLPKGFKIRKTIEGKTILSGSEVIGTMNVSTDGLVTIKYNDTYLNNLNDYQTLTGSFEVDAQIDMNKIDSSTGKVTITTPKGDITLNYGLDYKEHYGNVSVVDKSWEKEATSDYIKYTITLKAGDDGCQNVYVVDQFTQGKNLVEYVDINISETPLNGSVNKQQPYETRNTTIQGKIYKTDAPSSDQTIPDAVTNITNPESFVWKIDEMNPNEIRKLTYYVKLIDTTQNLYQIKKDVVNNAQVYSKREGSSQVYSKDHKESTFTPTIIIDTSVMKKNIVKQDDNKDYKKDNDGNYLVNYQIEFNYGLNNNVSIKGFQFADYLDYVDDYDFKTDSKMLPYISFVENSIVLHVKTAGESGYKEYKGNDKSPKIDYTITANEYGQTLLKNTTDKLTLVDDLCPNLVLDPDSIKAKNIKNNIDVPIEIKYDPEKNILEIQIPDGTPVQIQYSCKVKVAPKTETSVSNRVYWKNYGQTGGVNDEIKTFSYDLNASGTTETETHPQLTIIKYDDTLKRLSGAEFEIYECTLENNEIKRTTKNPFTVTSDANGTVTIKTSDYQMKFNTIYEVKETKTVDGYILDGNSYYIMRAKKEDSDDYSDYVKKYIEYQNSRDKHYIVAYDKDYFLVKIYNAQKGITVKKAFTNNAAETEHNPVSGTYRFGLYDNAEGSGDALEIISIHYDPKDKDVKSAKFKNPIDLTKDYYVFEIGQNNQPIKASDDEATINSMQYKVVYKNETDSTKTNNAKVGETVTVTNKSRTKILPSTGSMGTLIYRLLGATLVVASLICLSNINKNKRKEKRRKR